MKCLEEIIGERYHDIGLSVNPKNIDYKGKIR